MPNTKVFFGRTGAGDPNFNLISEPLTIIRQTGKDHLFASIFEPHGYFNEARESSRQARPVLQGVKIIGQTEECSVIEIVGNKDIYWRIMVNNSDTSEQTEHVLEFDGKTYKWTGNYHVDLKVK